MSIKSVKIHMIKVVLSMFIILTLVFFGIDTLNGDSATVLSGTSSIDDSIRRIQNQNVSFMDRYINWIISILTGNFDGGAFVKSPLNLIAERYLITLKLSVLSFLISIFFGITLGITVVARGRLSSVCSAIITFFLSITPILLALIFIYIFSVKLRLLPLSSSDGLSGYILPALTLGLSLGSITARFVISGLNEIVDKDFIHFSRLRGLSKRQALFRHGLLSIIGTLVGTLSVQLSFLLSGVVVIERVFTMPGLGDLLLSSILMRDIQTATLLASSLVIVIIFITSIADALAYFLTPELKS